MRMVSMEMETLQTWMGHLARQQVEAVQKIIAGFRITKYLTCTRGIGSPVNFEGEEQRSCCRM